MNPKVRQIQNIDNAIVFFWKHQEINFKNIDRENICTSCAVAKFIHQWYPRVMVYCTEYAPEGGYDGNFSTIRLPKHLLRIVDMFAKAKKTGRLTGLQIYYQLLSIKKQGKAYEQATS